MPKQSKRKHNSWNHKWEVYAKCKECGQIEFLEDSNKGWIVIKKGELLK